MTASSSSSSSWCSRLLFSALLLAPSLIASSTFFVAAAVVKTKEYDAPRSRVERPHIEPRTQLPRVTHKVFLDVVIHGVEPQSGRIVLGLFGDVAPKLVENFRSLCACDNGGDGAGVVAEGEAEEKPLCYKGSIFHRIIPNFMMQGGDITHGNGSGGQCSIYGGYFNDEPPRSNAVPHNKLYLLNSATKNRPNTNGSQFFISTVKTSWLDGKYVAFGVVLEGYEVVDAVEEVGSNGGEPRVKVQVEDSGEIPMDAHAAVGGVVGASE